MSVLGYRAFWALPEQGGLLTSYVMTTYVWQRDGNVASCSCGGTPTQHPERHGTGCGFHAWYHLRDLRRYLDNQRSEEDRPTKGGLWKPPSRTHLVCGVVAGYGTMELAEFGWRALRAKVVALFGESALAGRVAQRYAVPLYRIPRNLDGIERYFREWGLTPAEELRRPEID